MAASRITGHIAQVRHTLRMAFAEDHPPQLIGVSFAVGIFLTTLPSLGLIIPVLAWLGARFQWANRLSLLAAVAVMNPLAKGTVYVLSFLVGVQLLGAVEGASRADVGLDAGAAVLIRLLVGNVLLAVCFALVAYVLAYRTAIAIHRRRV